MKYYLFKRLQNETENVMEQAYRDTLQCGKVLQLEEAKQYGLFSSQAY